MSDQKVLFGVVDDDGHRSNVSDKRPAGGTYQILHTNTHGELVVDRVSTPATRAVEAQQQKEAQKKQAEIDCQPDQASQDEINDLSKQYDDATKYEQAAEHELNDAQKSLNDAVNHLNDVRGVGHYGSILVGGGIAAFTFVDASAVYLAGEVETGIGGYVTSAVTGTASAANSVLDGGSPNGDVASAAAEIAARALGSPLGGVGVGAHELVEAGEHALEFPDPIAGPGEDVPLNASDLFSAARGQYNLASYRLEDAKDELAKRKAQQKKDKDRLDKAKADEAARYGACVKARS